MADSISHRLFQTVFKYPQQIAIRYSKQRQWFELTWKEYSNQIECLAQFLENEGIKRGDVVAIFSDTRFEWSCLDHATLLIGGVVVPVYHNASVDEVEKILADCDVKFIFAENQKLIETVFSIREQLTHLQKVFCFEQSPSENNFEKTTGPVEKIHVDGFRQDNRFKNNFHFDQLIKNFKVGDSYEFWQKHLTHNNINTLATIVYTSGTTGQPKGVELTHKQILSEVTDAFPLLGMSNKDCMLTFLPFTHILGRIENWGHALIGYEMAFAESIERIRYNLPEVKPTVMIGVPRLFEKIQMGILSKVAETPLKKKAFDWALKLGMQVQDYRMKKETVPFALGTQYQLASRTVLKQIHNSLGGRLRFAMVGGAPLNAETAQFFGALGILLLEGYGLTETTAAITVNTPFDYMFGTVGKPIGDVQLKLASDGEILVKSAKVAKGYHNESPDERPNWEGDYFKTGDIGEFNERGFLKIIDRKKDLIKTSGGKYVAPQKLLHLLKQNPLIGLAHIVGDHRKYTIALISIDEMELEKLAKEYQLKGSFSDLVRTSEISSNIKAHIVNINQRLASYETIKEFALVPAPFTVETGELTPSLKVKKKVVEQKYQDLINALYHEKES